MSIQNSENKATEENNRYSAKKISSLGKVHRGHSSKYILAKRNEMEK